MTEEDAHRWLAEHSVASGEHDRLHTYAAMLIAENERQNLISPATIPHLWARHIVDSAQLFDLAPFAAERAVDIGSGGGLPGVVLAILGARITLCEPRRLRADFLSRCITELGLDASVVQKKGDGLAQGHGIVTARAVADPVSLVTSVGSTATYVLPRGRSFDIDYRNITAAYDGMFHVKQSVTSPDSAIIVADRLSRKAQ